MDDANLAGSARHGPGGSAGDDPSVASLRVGRSKIDRGLRDLIRRMSKENPQWGAARIHGELLMLGFEVAQSTV
jgi:hypothetical protein